MRLHEIQIDELKSVPSDIRDFAKTAGVTTKPIHRALTWTRELSAVAKKYNFVSLGSGTFATAYGNSDSPYVIKVFATGDHAYFQWMRFCLAHQNNPYLPKFKGKVVSLSPNLMAVRIERLTHFPEAQGWKIADVLSRLMDYYTSLVATPDYLGDQFRSTLLSQFPDFATDRDLAVVGEFLNARNDVDIHSGNIMLRGDQLVIIDPLYVVGFDKLM